MIARHIEVVDLEPLQWARFSLVFERLSAIHPQLVLWHEDGIPRRQLLDGCSEPVTVSRVDDARRVARDLYRKYGSARGRQGKIRRVVVTDLDGYDRLYTARNLTPDQDEEKYRYLERRLRAVREEFDSRVAIHPEPDLDRGPVPLDRMRLFLRGLNSDPCCLVLAVFDENGLYFSFVAQVREAEVDLVTSFDHWAGELRKVGFSSSGLERVTGLVGKEYCPVAGAFFLTRRDFDRLFDGLRHENLPAGLLESPRAFCFSAGRRETLDETMLCTAGLFAYAPLRVP
ncbi:MAG: hypothetical protein U9P14_03660 [Gemmatimonadota bacterium]|nr:hypothetical protein [Gemmatimonadota bacterium]